MTGDLSKIHKNRGWAPLQSQVEIAAEIGVPESTVWNWEHVTEPELIHIPACLTFIGYVPWELPEEPVSRLAHFKKVKGLSFERLGKLMSRDPEQLADWISGRNMPIERNQRMIAEFLDEHYERESTEERKD
jgi:transcriptional regulator with XRE-family HTH domain